MSYFRNARLSSNDKMYRVSPKVIYDSNGSILCVCKSERDDLKKKILFPNRVPIMAPIPSKLKRSKSFVVLSNLKGSESFIDPPDLKRSETFTDPLDIFISADE
jgi:hypothetical protein